MGLFDWLFGRKKKDLPPQASSPGRAAAAVGPERIKLPRPANVRPLGDNSPMVVFEQGSATVVMDRDAYDYTYGNADGPDPAQRDLDVLLPKVTRVCVLASAMFQGKAMTGKVLVDTADRRALEELAAALKIVEDPRTFGHCNCLGGPTMELYEGLSLSATIGLQHGRAIRWSQWYHDAQLQNGEKLTRWLEANGVNPVDLRTIYERGDNFLFQPTRPPSERQQRAWEFCDLAQQQARQGNFAEALRLCNDGFAADPDNLDLRTMRGQVLYFLNRITEAGEDCAIALRGGIRHAEISFILGVAADMAARYDEALAHCAMALHLNPNHAGAYHTRGLIRGRRNEFDDANGDFSTAIRIAPSWFLPYLHRAQTCHQIGKLDLALADYNQALALLDGDPVASSNAETDAMRCLIYCRRGDAYFQTFCEEEAATDFAQARLIDAAAAAYYLGDMWLRRSRFDLAESEYSQAIQLAPENARGYVGRGMAHEGLGNLDDAVADYSAAIAMRAPNDPSYALRARVRQRQGMLTHALADLTQHLMRFPSDPFGLHARAHVYQKQGNYQKALDDLKTGYQIAPNDAMICNLLAWILATAPDSQFRDGPRAVELAKKACEASKWEVPNCIDTLAAAYAEVGDFAEAVRLETQAIQSVPPDLRDTWNERLELYKSRKPCRV